MSAGELKKQGFNAVKMYELQNREAASGKENPPEKLTAIVRYIRHTGTYDPKGVVNLPSKIRNHPDKDPNVKYPGEGGDYGETGFHRPGERYIGEVTFQYVGGHASTVGSQKETSVKPWKKLRPTKSN